MLKTEYQTSLTERSAYGAFFFGQNLMFMLVLQFLNLFYTDIFGLSAAAVGILMLVARTWDAINDPLLGNLVDRAQFKGGKFLPWIKAVNILLPLATLALFYVPDISASSKLLYAYITYIAWGMIYTLCDVPIFALSTAMSKHSDERVMIQLFGRFAALVAMIVIAVATIPIVTQWSWFVAAAVFTSIAAFTMTPIRFFAKERVKAISQQPSTLSSSFKFLFNHKPMLVFYTANLILLGSHTSIVAGNYFAIYNIGNGTMAWVMPLLVAQLIPMLLLLPALPTMIRKFGKKNIFVWGTLTSAFFGILQYVLGYENTTLVLILQSLKSIGFALPMMMIGMFSADFVEYGFHHQKQRLEGAVFSIQTFMVKFTSALAAGIGGILLAMFGYVANSAQSAESLEGIFMLYSLFPAIGSVLAALVMAKFYTLHESDIDKMASKI